MKKILQKCETADFEYLSKVLDSYFSFTNDTKRKKLLADIENPTSKQELIELIDEQIRYYGSSDIGYFYRYIFHKEAGVSTEELIKDVAEKLKVKIKFGASTERSLELLANATIEKEFHNKSPEELSDYFEKFSIGNAKKEQILEKIKGNAKVAILPILYRILGPKTTLVIIQNTLVAIIAQIIGKEMATVIITEMIKRNPWLNSLGPIVWAISGSWLAIDLQGEAYRKTIPICLYLSMVALRDGEEKE